MTNKNKVGIVFGAVLGGFHLMWSLLIFVGVAQMVLDFVFWAHMIYLPIVVGPFNLVAAVTLVVFTAVSGYVFGYVGAWAWNRARA